MVKFISIFLLFFYTVGSIWLPRGDFAYIEQIPQLYKDFAKANDENDFFEFLEEQFFEYSFLENEGDKDNPYEKETKPVPFYSLTTQAFVALPYFEKAKLSVHPPVKTNHCTEYTLADYWVYPTSIFHPPKA